MTFDDHRRGDNTPYVFKTDPEQLEPPVHSLSHLGWRGLSHSWRELPVSQWQVTPETARLLRHWRHHPFSDIRPFFCQVEAAETIIWLTEVAPHLVVGKKLLNHLDSANKEAGTNLQRVALKLATGAGKTAVMAMLIAWQTVNAVRRPGSKTFTRGFLVVTPGLTVRDRLRVLNPHDPDNSTPPANWCLVTCWLT